MSQPILQFEDSEEAEGYDELVDDEAQDFQIDNRLPTPQAMMYRTEDLRKLMHIGEIDLDPPYQRDVVWPESKQIKLIDSLYHNYYIPPVVFTIFKKKGSEIRRCVDGKQRLTAIRKFIDGQIPYRDPSTGRSFWYTSSTPGRQIIPTPWKDDFSNKLLTCVEYRELPDGLERDIFQRVQLGIPLTAAEKLQAHSSPWADYISTLTQMRLVNTKGISAHITVDTTRGRDFQAMAQMVYCCEGLPEQRNPTAHKLDKWLQQTEPPTPQFQNDINKTLQTFQLMASTPGLDIGFTEIQNRVAPAEFIFTGVLLYVMRDCDFDKIADQILAMRQDARNHYKDIRVNNVVVRHLWGFVSRLAATLDTGVYVEDNEKSRSKSKSKPVPRRNKKRRRTDDADDEDA
ncbi:hypothetical protein BDY19DRAFT_903148 [Irpex rosettiformis]|uniref:Uncharacterized protein n=1 Tax=Irpex rosettiformis TaxID=378272 RepID=A0ACB8UG61_9APHY|nr:hypothetical protein BDY19DRAFT_903148 [Irpex rosettiformis]